MAEKQQMSAVAEDAADTPAQDVSSGHTETHRRLLAGVIVTLAGAACWGFSGTCAKFLMEAYGVDPIWLIVVRELGSCPLFLVAAWVTNREALLAVPKSRAARLEVLKIAIGVVLLSQAGYIMTIAWTNSATATVLQSLNLLLVLAYVCVHERRHPHRRELLGMLLALVGTYLIATGGNPGQLQIAPQGLAWAVVMIVAAALMAILPVKALARWGSFVVNGYAMLVSGVILLVLTRPWEMMPTLDAAGWGWIAAIVVVGTFGAYALFLQGVKMVGSLKANLLGTMEPVTATVLSILWMGTAFSPVDLVGFALVIAMVFLTV